MARYRVTLEIKTPYWKRVLRWFKLIPKISTFILSVGVKFKTGDILFSGKDTVKVIEKL